ncbi:Activator of stress protein [Paramyrothecium foliicola]|nr:Activator of stress protein [Paramyrothecium foliicola]
MSDASSSGQTARTAPPRADRNPKRRSEYSPTSNDEPVNRRKTSKKGFDCQYDASYRRGRPPTPPVAAGGRPVTPRSSFDSMRRQVFIEMSKLCGVGVHQWNAPSARASPGIDTAEIEGQLIDHTSNLSFIHRAWKRLAGQGSDTISKLRSSSDTSQLLASAGDKPFSTPEGNIDMFVNQEVVTGLFNFYFDHCVVTYRMLNQEHCFSWLNTILCNAHNNLPLETELGNAKAAAVVCILAIASLRQHNTSAATSSSNNESDSLHLSEGYFKCSLNLVAAETGLPKLESVQSRTLQVLYLLQSSRMNQAWYAFGSTVPIVSALGLHRKATRHRAAGSRTPTMDYITTECRKRTFWSVYIIDKYLAVVFGRPRFYHEEDIDQDYPQKVNDEDMTPQGPAPTEPKMDCHIDALIFHARIAQIIDSTSREVYSLKQTSSNNRFSAAQKFTQELHEWRAALPYHLGAVRPSSLIPSFSRQSTCLKLAYDHAIMHANRPFLLDQPKGVDAAALQQCVAECISAARDALETIDRMFPDKIAVFHSLWWTPYLTFCALAVVYVWEITQKASGTVEVGDPSLFALAERCQSHLSSAITSDSASRRYSVIIEELRLEARQHFSQSSGPPAGQPGLPQAQQLDLAGHPTESNLDSLGGDLGVICEDQEEVNYANAFNPLSQWQATDWLEIDSSVSATELFAAIAN